MEVRHCRIHDTAGTGLILFNEGVTGLFEDVEIDHNTTNAVWQSTVNMNPTYSNLRLHDNGVDALVIVGATVNRDVTLDGSPAALNGAPIHLSSTTVGAGRTLTVTAGTLLKMQGGLGVNGTLVAEGEPSLLITLTAQSGNWVGVGVASGAQLRLAYCDLGYAGGWGDRFSIWLYSGADAQVEKCRIHHSAGHGLVANGAQVSVRNLALVDNASNGLWLSPGAHLEGRHLTLARNGTGAKVDSSATLLLTNTILAENTTGVNVASGGSATLSHTLWDHNVTPIVGVVNETGHVDGPAAFEADGYHLTRYSAALGRGLEAGVADDIDGQPRPMPMGTGPDLGADEYPITFLYMPAILRQHP